MTQLADPVRLDVSLWRLDANPEHLESVARAWRDMGAASAGCGDALAAATRSLSDGEWSGPASDSFAGHQSRLIADLRAARGEADGVGATLDRWAGLLRLYQSALDAELAVITGRVRANTVYQPFGKGWVVFYPGTPDEIAAVHAAAARAGTIKAELDEALARELPMLHAGDWTALAATWLSVAEESSNLGLSMPAEATDTSVLMVDGRAVINTGPGQDSVEVMVNPLTGAVEVIVNGSRHDYPSGTPITIRGGDGDDTISVYPGADVTLTLLGGAGNDIIRGGDGGEVMLGGAGRDEIYGGRGGDYGSGGAGDDYIDGQDSDDVLSGGLGDDVVYGLGDSDYVAGGDGDDYLEGARGDDVLDGGAGRDVVSGGSGDDHVSGGTGDDRLYGGEGSDRIAGGGGTDTAFRQRDDTASAVSHDIRVEVTGDHGFLRVQGTPEFQQRILADLEMYRGSPTGQQMLQALSDKSERDWFPGENTLTIREYDKDNAATETEYRVYHDTTIKVNPEHVSPDESGGSPSVVLYHELGHVYHYWNWSFDGGGVTVSDGPDHGLPKDDRRATGLPIDHDGSPAAPKPETPEILDPRHPFVYTENALRHEMGLPNRDTYKTDGD